MACVLYHIEYASPEVREFICTHHTPAAGSPEVGQATAKTIQNECGTDLDSCGPRRDSGAAAFAATTRCSDTNDSVASTHHAATGH